MAGRNSLVFLVAWGAVASNMASSVAAAPQLRAHVQGRSELDAPVVPGHSLDKRAREGASHVVLDPRDAATAEWIAVVPRRIAGELEGLARHRETHGVKSAAIVCVEDLTERFRSESRPEGSKATDGIRDAIVQFARDARARGGARFLFLVGSADDIPAGVVRAGDLTRFECASDVVYVKDDDDALPDAAVGRFPSSNAERVRTFTERVVDYESRKDPAGWRRRISFLAGSGGFGAALDGAIDAAVSGLLDRELPPEFDLRVLRPDKTSAFGVKPEAEAEAIQDLWNSGSLVFLYAGHGSRQGLHTATGLGFTRTIFTSTAARSLAIRNGSPFVMLFACNTAEFAPVKSRKSASSDGGAEAAPSCLGEALLVNPKGAIAVLGASEVSHPYPDLLLAHEFNELFRSNAKMPLGEMVLQAKRRSSEEGGEYRKNVDAIAALFGLVESERRLLIEHEQALYQYFGDPALVLNGPDVKLEVAAPEAVKPGEEFEFTVKCDGLQGSRLVARLETSRAATPRVRGYPSANDRTLDRIAGRVEGPVFKGRMTAPAGAGLRRFLLTVDVLRDGTETGERNDSPPVTDAAAPSMLTGLLGIRRGFDST